MVETFHYSGNEIQNVISINSEDVTIKWKKKPRGYAICDISFSSATIPQGSYISLSHSASIEEKQLYIEKRKELIPSGSSELKTNANKKSKHQFQTNITIQDTNPGFLINVLAGSSVSGPSEWKLNSPQHPMHNWSMNEFYGARLINENTELTVSTPNELAQYIDLYRLSGTESDFEDWIKTQSSAGAVLFNSTKNNIVGELLKVLPWKKNVILEGVPGVGKTFHINRLKEELGIEDGDDRFASVTFSPSIGTEEFIGGLFPKPGISPPVFVFEKGPLLKLAETAASASSDTKHLLFIDEINRGNIPKIMGEIMTVIEGTKRFSLDVSSDVLAKRQDGEDFRASMFLNGEQIRYFGLPENLYIIGAMNTSDRSVVQIDSALRRRFAFIRVDTLLVSESSDELKQLLLTSPNAVEFWSPDQRMTDADGVLQSLFKLNEFLRENVGPDAMLGHSYLFDLKCCSQQATDEGEGEIDENCFWRAIRDMLLLSVYPQLADTIASNGVGDEHVVNINKFVDELNSAVNIHLTEASKLGCNLKKPSSPFGQYRME